MVPLARLTVLACVSFVLVGGCRRSTGAPLPGGARCEERTVTVPEGLLHTVRLFDYDAEGRMVRAEWQYHEFVIEQLGAVRTYSYGTNGLLASESLDENLDGKPETVIEYRYDDRGRIVGAQSKSSGGASVATSDIGYDDAGRRVRQEWRHGGTVTSTQTVTYSSDGRERTRVSTPAGSRGHSVREELDIHNDILKQHIREDSGERLALEVARDASNRVTSVTHFAADGAVESVSRYRYDPKGLLVGSALEVRGRPSLTSTVTYSGAWKAVQCGVLPGLPDTSERVP
jgi:hypothetical protein